MIARRAELGDAPDLMSLYSELMGNGPLGEVSDLASVLHHSGTQIWVAISEDRVVAMATLHVLPNVTWGGRPYGVVENVVTAARARGCGAGACVMQAAISSAWAQGAYKIMLMTGRSTDARGFYEKLGFVADEKLAMTMRRVPIRSAV